ncbi:MAG: Wzz/FepE/Etk N-terminal domain-containing protein [Patescibacteria group bacterium]|jgi:capsular polysaccharide biosynthesis protein
MRYLLLIKEHWLVITCSTLVCAAIAVGLSFIPDQLYKSEVDLLIVQKQSATVDSYTAQRAAASLGNSLVNVITSLDFLNRVLETGQVKPEQFSIDSNDKKSAWEKLVSAEVVPETGIIKIFGYGTNPANAEGIATGVAQVLTTNSSDYYGGGDSVYIKQIEGPVTSNRPVKPNIPLNGAAAGALGLLASYTYYLLKFEAKRTRYIAFPQESPVETPKVETLPNKVETPRRGVSTIVEPVEPPQYKVLDRFNAVDGKPDEPVSMQDHLKR